MQATPQIRLKTKMDYSVKFDSPWDFINEARKEPNKTLAKCDRAREAGKHDSFYGGTLPEACKMAEQGWEDAPDLSAVCNAVLESGQGQAMRELTVASVSGAFLDIGAFVSGEPECFQEFTPVETPRGFSLGVALNAHSGISKEQKILRGSVMMAVAQTLERSGFVVELIALMSSENDGHREILTFPLKRAGERVDQNQISYWSCHDSAFRQIWFSYQDTRSDKYIKDFNVGHGRGRPMRCTPKEAGVDYNFSANCNPRNEKEALEAYKQVMCEIALVLAKGPA